VTWKMGSAHIQSFTSVKVATFTFLMEMCTHFCQYNISESGIMKYCI